MTNYLGKIFVQIYKKIAIFVRFNEKMMKKPIFYAILLLLFVSAFSCKKNEESTTKPSLAGLYITGDHKNFMGEGTVVHFKADVEDLYVSDFETELPDPIGIYFTVSSDVSIKDTVTRDINKSNPEFTVCIDEEGTYTVQCFAYGGDAVYNASASVSFTIVNPETALSGLPDLPTVEIDGNVFKTTEREGKTWMANNLYGTEAGTYYQESDILGSLFGKYYTWTEAQTACPSGWHLPTSDEFDECFGGSTGDLMVNASFVSVTMWEYWPQVIISNSTNFCALPVGYRDYTNETAPETGYKKYACFWTKDEVEDRGVFRSIYEQDELVQKSQGDKNTLALSVRCIKD